MISSDCGPWSIVPEWLLNRPVSDRAIRLYALLGRYADQEGRCTPSRRVLSVRLNCSPDSVDRAKQELVEAGALTWNMQVRPGTRERTSNEYVVMRSDPEVAARLRPPSRMGAATVAAPVRQQEREPSEREPMKLPVRSNRRKPQTPIPIPFVLEEEHYAWAERECPRVDVDAETENFVSWWRAKDGRFADWHQAWRNWMRKSERRLAAGPQRRPA